MEINSKKEERIFVNIASYRDPECQHTLFDLFSKAKFSERVFVGICWQFSKEEDGDCFKLDLNQWKSQIRTHEMPYEEARGPCLARHLAQKLWNGEEFYLQIDSHCRFVQNWDVKLVDWLLECEKKSKKPILTAYPVSYQLENNIPGKAIVTKDKKPSFLCAKEFGPIDGMFRLNGKLLNRIFSEPLLSLFWVSGFSFSRSSMIKQVPYDLHLPYLFFGEEQLMMTRLWTNGFDFYCPPESVIFHLYSRSYRKTFREIVDPKRRELELYSLKRVCSLMNISVPSKLENEIETLEKTITKEMSLLVENDFYGLGKERTLKEYEEFCQVDFQKRSFLSEKAKDGGLDKKLFLDSVLDMIQNAMNISGQNVDVLLKK